MVDNYTLAIANNSIINCIERDCDRILHSTIERYVKSLVIYLFGFLLVISQPDNGSKVLHKQKHKCQYVGTLGHVTELTNDVTCLFIHDQFSRVRWRDL